MAAYEPALESNYLQSYPDCAGISVTTARVCNDKHISISILPRSSRGHDAKSCGRGSCFFPNFNPAPPFKARRKLWSISFSRYTISSFNFTPHEGRE